MCIYSERILVCRRCVCCVLCLMCERERVDSIRRSRSARRHAGVLRERVTDGARDERERCGVRGGSIVRKREPMTTLKQVARTPLVRRRARVGRQLRGHVHHAAQTPSRRGRRPSIRPPPSTCGKFHRRRDHRTGSGMGGGPRTACRAQCGVRQRGANTAAATRAAASAVRRAATATSTAR